MDSFAVLSDNPVRTAQDDLWNLRAVAAELAQIISSVADPPFTLGVFGGWGSGKTSLLSLLADELKAPGDTRVAWFNAWHYREQQEIWPALVQCVVTALRDTTTSAAILERLADFGRAAARTFFGVGAQVLSHGIVSVADVSAVLDRYSQLQAERTQEIADFPAKFDEITSEALDGRLVVLVDDLDRCSPDAALEILEGIKLFLQSEHCVFVVALDPAAIFEALRARYPLNEEYRVNYLERHIQLVRYVPEPGDEQLRAGLSTVCRADFPDALWHLVHAAAEGNPRRAKRFLNMLLLAKNGPGGGDDLLGIAKIIVFRIQFPEFFAALTRDPALWSDLELAVRQRDSELRTDPRVGPFLADVRLTAFLRETGPDSRFHYPKPPDDSRSVLALLRRAWRYGPATDQPDGHEHPLLRRPRPR